jgi:hypothetical protein
MRTCKGLDPLSVPVKRPDVSTSEFSMELVDQSFVNKMLKSLRANYAKAPLFAVVA